MKKLINGETIDMKPAEVAVRQAEELAAQNAKPMQDWQASMDATDIDMPRYIEDILDKIGTTGLPQEMIDRHANKKALRAAKPQSRQ